MLRGRVIEQVFGGESVFGNIRVQNGSSTSPHGVITEPRGTWLIINYGGDASHLDVYLNNTGSDGWVLVHNQTA